jgi:hypothetical protein
MCVHVRSHVHTHVHACEVTCTPHVHACEVTCTHTCARSHVHTHVHACEVTCTHTCTCIWGTCETKCTCTCEVTCTHVCACEVRVRSHAYVSMHRCGNMLIAHVRQTGVVEPEPCWMQSLDAATVSSILMDQVSLSTLHSLAED